MPRIRNCTLYNIEKGDFSSQLNYEDTIKNNYRNILCLGEVCVNKRVGVAGGL